MTDETPYSSYARPIEELTLGAADDTVVIRKLQTRKGQRLELHVPADDITLGVDALGLESLAWQPRDIFSNFTEDSYERSALDPQATDVDTAAKFELTNEYAHVLLCHLRSGDQERLQIRAPKKRERIQASPAALRGLTSQDHTLFSTFLEHPHGPEDH